MMLLIMRTLKSTIQYSTAYPMLLLTECSHEDKKGLSPFLADSRSRDSLNMEFHFRTAVYLYTCIHLAGAGRQEKQVNVQRNAHKVPNFKVVRVGHFKGFLVSHNHK